MDTNEFPGTDQGYSRSYRAWRIIGIIGAVVAVVASSFWIYNRINDSRRITTLEGWVKELKAAADKPAAPAVPCVTAPATPFAIVPIRAPAATAPSVAPKVVPLSAPAGEYAVQLHTLFRPRQFKVEERETANAFYECGKDITLTFCLAKVNGHRNKMASLAKSANGMTIAEAKKLAACFNNSMAINGQTNAAEPVLLKDFAADCETPTE